MIVRLKDGTQDMIFTPEHFNRLVLDKLGDDAGNYLDGRIQELQDEADYTAAKIDTDMDSYEASLDSYNALCSDLLESISQLRDMLSEKRIQRRNMEKIINEMEREINNVY